MRVIPTLCAAGCLLLGVHAPAAGHAELVPWRLPPGETGGLLLMVTHGCGDEDEWISAEPLEEEPTIAVTVQVPLELDMTPVAVEGWSLSTEDDGSGALTSATWRHDDPAGTSETVQLPIDVTVADVPDGSEVWIPVIQECTGGESLEWTLEDELRGGDQVPAMMLSIRDDATLPAIWGTETIDADSLAAAEAAAAPSPLERFGLPSAALAVLGLGGLWLALRRRERRTSASSS